MSFFVMSVHLLKWYTTRNFTCNLDITAIYAGILYSSTYNWAFGEKKSLKPWKFSLNKPITALFRHFKKSSVSSSLILHYRKLMWGPKIYRIRAELRMFRVCDSLTSFALQNIETNEGETLCCNPKNKSRKQKKSHSVEKNSKSVKITKVKITKGGSFVCFRGSGRRCFRFERCSGALSMFWTSVNQVDVVEQKSKKIYILKTL